MPRWINVLLVVGAPLFGAQCTSAAVPSLDVPACVAGKGSVQYDKSVPNGESAFPLTQVDLCYTDNAINIVFTAHEEINFYYNASQTTNDAIYNYEVMEAFIYRGTNDPQTYLEFEVSPNNVTFQAFIYNPTKVRVTGAPFDTFYVAEPLVDGLIANTVLNPETQTWTSAASIPLGLFNVDNGQAQGTQWRMNFFRTIVSPDTFPDQGLGAWSPTNQSSFHMTPFFGNVQFV
ncbi:Uu.00g075150.m01.CDS01 [Anthostomella pinea]|uniref:Uu.00g075150.m01.CDS01 n=1 Tax=Anthostomella pinea TaxID=933095 RepID=A0AAI8VW80_9PEZI|nr:Uu.00g075150.m01.CDS01 [Anthostomella pinea]